MRIAIVAEPFVPIPPKKYGGIERVIDKQIKGLQELGHEVLLLAPGDSKVDCELIPICQKHISIGKSDKAQKEIVLLNEQIRKNTYKIMDRIMDRVDVVHSHGIDLSPIHDKIPSVTTLHGMFVLKQMDYFKARRDLNWIAISQNQKAPFPDLNYLGVVYNGLDPDDFEFNDKPEEYLSFIGRFDREKNPSEAIKLALALDMKIKIAGKVDFQGSHYFKKEIKPYLTDPRVEWLGEIGMDKKIELLRNAKCNIHPIAFREPFGLTVLEAAYCGTPTLAINRGSMSEIIENGRTGMLVEDIQEGYFKIKECFNMDREYISNRARMLFNYKKMSREYLKMYRKAIAIFKEGKKPFLKTNGVRPKDKYTSPISLFWEN